jgi:DNA helicase-2/ATP-dependent DNA helicase PcrA
MPPEIDLLLISRGAITAPAGCGKTELIAAAACAHGGPKPLLVLTHTNAGVAALRSRLERAGVATTQYRVSTIDGWAMRVIATFPMRSGHDPTILALTQPRRDYPAIRAAALQLLAAAHINDVIRASYAQLIVDEYQDCTIPQHRIVCALAGVLPTCVLGDPMQAIFGFAEPLAHWTQHTCEYFAPAGELQTPWRWLNTGAEPLGRWLLEVRARLVAGQSIDLRTAPGEVTWVPLRHAEDHERRLAAARTRPPTPEGRVLVIGDSINPDSHWRVASQTPGAVTVESVDLRHLVAFGTQFRVESPDALDRLLTFAQSAMTHASAQDFLRRIDTLRAGRARNPATPAETAALTFLAAPSLSGAATVLSALRAQPHTRTHRPAIFYGAMKALRTAATTGCSLPEAALSVREENRHVGRTLPNRAVGSTLLLKGLEAEVAVILNADALNAANLYVAMTRGSMRLVVCSVRPELCS